MPDAKQSKGGKACTPRKTPSSRAREFKGEVKIGTDGNPWVSIPNKNMNYSWQPYGGTSHNNYIEKIVNIKDIDSVKNFVDNLQPDSPKETVVKKADKKKPYRFAIWAYSTNIKGFL